MATLGNPNCPKDSVTSLLVRSWMIDTPYKNWENVRIFLKDVQTTLVRIQEDFPNLCDFYTLVIHPQYEKLAMNLGFQKIGTDPQSSLYWMYTAVEQYLNLDIEEVVAKLEFGSLTPEF